MPGSGDENNPVLDAAELAVRGVGSAVASGAIKVLSRSIKKAQGKVYWDDDQKRMKRWQEIYQEHFDQPLPAQYTTDAEGQPLATRKDDNWTETKQRKLKKIKQEGDFSKFAKNIAGYVAKYIEGRKGDRSKRYDAGDFTEQWLAELSDWALNVFYMWGASKAISKNIETRIAYCKDLLDDGDLISDSRDTGTNLNQTKRGVLNLIISSLKNAQKHCSIEVVRQSAHHKLGVLRKAYTSIVDDAMEFCYLFRNTPGEYELSVLSSEFFQNEKNPIHRKLGEFIDYRRLIRFDKTSQQPHEGLQPFPSSIEKRRADQIPSGVLTVKCASRMESEPVIDAMPEEDILDFFSRFFACFANISHMKNAIELAYDLTGDRGDLWAYKDKRGSLSFRLLLNFALHQLQAAQDILSLAVDSDFRNYYTRVRHKGSKTIEYKLAMNCINQASLCSTRVRDALEVIKEIQAARTRYTAIKLKEFEDKQRLFFQHVLYFSHDHANLAHDREISTLREFASRPSPISIPSLDYNESADDHEDDGLQTAKETTIMPRTPDHTDTNSLHKYSVSFQDWQYFSVSPDEMDEKQREDYLGHTGGYEYSDDDQDDERTPFLPPHYHVQTEAVELEAVVSDDAPAHASLCSNKMVTYSKQGVPIEKDIVTAIKATLDSKQPLPPLSCLYQEMLFQAVASGDLQTLRQFVGEGVEYNGFDLINAALVYIEEGNPNNPIIQTRRLAQWRQRIGEMQQELPSIDPNNPFDCSDILLSALSKHQTLLQYAMQQFVHNIKGEDVEDSPIWPVIEWLHTKHPTQLFEGEGSSPVMVGLQSKNVKVNKAVLKLALTSVSAVLKSKSQEAAADLDEIQKAWDLLKNVEVYFDRYGHSLFARRSFREVWNNRFCLGDPNIHSYGDRERIHRMEFAQLMSAYQVAATINEPHHLSGEAATLRTINKRSYLRRGEPFSHVLKA